MPGEILKKRREELGKDLKEIAHTLKIRYDYLKAIEDGAFEKLPEEVYVKGYIRDYAKFLKIDPEIIIKAYIEKTSPAAIEKSLPPSVDAAPTKKLKIKYFLVAIILLVAAVAYVLFHSAPEKPKTAPSEITIPPPSIAPDVSSAPESLTTRSDQPLQQVQPVQEDKEITGKTGTLSEHILEISAIETTWLLVNIDNTDSKEMLLKQDDSVRLSARQSFLLKIGNAGGIKLVLDGKEIGTPGEKGQVITLNLPREENVTPGKPLTE